MKQPHLRRQRLRFTLALAATGASVDIVAYERHFSLDLAHPTTYPVILQHKCGVLLLLCLSWLLYEVMTIIFAFQKRTFTMADL